MTVLKGNLKLSQWRGLREMTKTELSEKSGVSMDTIQRLESSQEMMERANYSTLKALADALGVKVQNFFE